MFNSWYKDLSEQYLTKLILENLNKVKCKDKVHIFGQMVKYIEVNGKATVSMVMASFIGLMVHTIKVNIKMIKEMVKV
jgi:hypothetical protein